MKPRSLGSRLAAAGNLSCTNCRVQCRFCTLRQWNYLGRQCRWPRPHVAQLAALDLRLQSCIAKEQKDALDNLCNSASVLGCWEWQPPTPPVGLIHILLVVGLVVLIIRLIQGRRIAS